MTKIDELFLEYAFPTSPRAARLGYESTGCFYISRGEAWSPRKILAVFQDKQTARDWLNTTAKDLHMGIGRYSL